MSGTRPVDCTEGARRGSGSSAGRFGMVEWLSLAAAPTFVIMAVLTSVAGGGPMDALCSVGQGFALSGMVPMYLLMALFHASPWLRLISGR